MDKRTKLGFRRPSPATAGISHCPWWTCVPLRFPTRASPLRSGLLHDANVRGAVRARPGAGISGEGDEAREAWAEEGRRRARAYSTEAATARDILGDSVLQELHGRRDLPPQHGWRLYKEVYTKPFSLLPLSAVEKPGNLLMQGLLDRLVPMLGEQLLWDYHSWLQQQPRSSS